jgi:hypothetical protein
MQATAGIVDFLLAIQLNVSWRENRGFARKRHSRVNSVSSTVSRRWRLCAKHRAGQLEPNALNNHRLDPIAQHLDYRINLIVMVTAREREKLSQQCGQPGRGPRKPNPLGLELRGLT